MIRPTRRFGGGFGALLERGCVTHDPTNPLIVQGDRSILVEVDNPKYEEARDALAPFAELEKSPEHIHTYRLTDLSLWNAAAAGMSAEAMVAVLAKFTKFPIPSNLPVDIAERVSRYGRVRLIREGGGLRLICGDKPLLKELARHKELRQYLGDAVGENGFAVEEAYRGVVKQALISVGYPAEDLAGYVEGADQPIGLRARMLDGAPLVIRDYQREAVEAFHAGGEVRGGSGVVVLPCGAGKTIVGIVALAKLQKSTLVLTTGITSVKQWRRELLDKTDLDESLIGEFTGESKEIRPITLATYQIVTYRPAKGEDFPHFEIFNKRDWGLIIYDEVHLLPAPVFRVTADIQARRRLGLTATLVREDGREGDVFTLIGPKKYDVPWRVLESKGWIAEAACSEVRCGLPDEFRMEYAVAPWRQKYRLASENPIKDDVVGALVEKHAEHRVLIIGQYLEQLRRLARRFRLPLITGQTSQVEREALYKDFRDGNLKRLILSKVGNFALDLPDANVLIQVSGTFGSRQEEAQRLGRVLRPKTDGKGAHFYTLVTRDTKELDFALHRQLFLTEQGYSYEILDQTDVLPATAAPRRVAAGA
jgi:DNA excision repair protein ERCC-3